tara:strand:+ start:861 stop:1745 length:885 start_codon:yes stop_codon:yes gene_type:complete
LLEIIGSIGLGAMGGSYAFHLLNNGYEVLGLDPDIKNSDKFSKNGGVIVNNISNLLEKSDVMILSLPTVPIFKSVIKDIVENYDGTKSKILIDMNTISLEDKLSAKNQLNKLNIEMIDAPVSGTGAQAKTKDLVIMSSGSKESISLCEKIFLSFSRENIFVGEFGNGIKFKILANLLVTVHNTATAEALLLGQKAGLDESLIYKVLNAGAAASVMLDKRMPLMISKNYEPATASMTIFLKDIDVIRQFLKNNNTHSPTFEAAAKVYDQAKLNIPSTYDTAAVFEQLIINNKLNK